MKADHHKYGRARIVLVFNQKINKTSGAEIAFTLYLTASARLKSQQRLELPGGETVYLRLPRGTVLQPGDLLRGENQDLVVEIAPKPEAVITVRAENRLLLLQGAYHLGNRHVPLEIKPDYLRLSPDPVLAKLLEKLGLEITVETAPFYPELGAYHE